MACRWWKGKGGEYKSKKEQGRTSEGREQKGERPGGKVESRVSDIAGSKTTGKRGLDE